METERELEGLKGEMMKLTEHLQNIDIDVCSDAIADILDCLVSGATAETIIADFALVDEAGV